MLHWEAAKCMETIPPLLSLALTYAQSTHTLIRRLTCVWETVTIPHTNKVWLWGLILSEPAVSIVNP